MADSLRDSETVSADAPSGGCGYPFLTKCVSGDLTTLGTYDRETESPVEDQHLEALVDAVKTLACDQDGFDDLDREQQGNLTAALNAVEEVLDQ